MPNITDRPQQSVPAREALRDPLTAAAPATTVGKTSHVAVVEDVLARGLELGARGDLQDTRTQLVAAPAADALAGLPRFSLLANMLGPRPAADLIIADPFAFHGDPSAHLVQLDEGELAASLQAKLAGATPTERENLDALVEVTAAAEASLARGEPAIPAPLLVQMERSSLGLGGLLATGDLDTLVTLVMMALQRDNAGDLRDLLAQMQSRSEKKQDQRRYQKWLSEVKSAWEHAARSEYQRRQSNGESPPSETFEAFASGLTMDLPVDPDAQGPLPAPSSMVWSFEGYVSPGQAREQAREANDASPHAAAPQPPSAAEEVAASPDLLGYPSLPEADAQRLAALYGLDAMDLHRLHAVFGLFMENGHVRAHESFEAWLALSYAPASGDPMLVEKNQRTLDDAIGLLLAMERAKAQPPPGQPLEPKESRAHLEDIQRAIREVENLRALQGAGLPADRLAEAERRLAEALRAPLLQSEREALSAWLTGSGPGSLSHELRGRASGEFESFGNQEARYDEAQRAKHLRYIGALQSAASLYERQSAPYSYGGGLDYFDAEAWKRTPNGAFEAMLHDWQRERAARHARPVAAAARMTAVVEGGRAAHRDGASERTVRFNELPSLIDSARDQIDATSELDDQASLRLQMIMDRKSKLATTLSNIMKKRSDTEGSITANLK